MSSRGSGSKEKTGHAVPAVAQWCRDVGLAKWADVIVSLEEGWRKQGKKTRRDWWLVMSGTRAGAPCMIAGHTFPVLAAARARCGFPPVDGAVELPTDVVLPAMRPSIRE